MGLAGDLSSAGTQYKITNNARKDLSKANKELTAKMTAAQGDYAALRPEAAQNRMAALKAQLGLLSPLNQLTSQITGQAPIDTSAVNNFRLQQSPLPSMMAERSKQEADLLTKLTQAKEFAAQNPRYIPGQTGLQNAQSEYDKFIGSNPQQSSAPPAQPATRTRRGVR